MAWVDLADERGGDDRPVDSGTCVAIQSRLTQIYTQSIYDINDCADPPEASRADLLTTVGWKWYGVTATAQHNAFPILARCKAGGDPREVTVEFDAKAASADAWKLRVYLLESNARFALDAADAVVGRESYKEFDIASSTYVTQKGDITPELAGALVGDGLVAGFSQPVYWVHMCVLGTSVVQCDVTNFRLIEKV